jgi:hypothetical protein
MVVLYGRQLKHLTCHSILSRSGIRQNPCCRKIPAIRPTRIGRLSISMVDDGPAGVGEVVPTISGESDYERNVRDAALETHVGLSFV